jgi:hypothetical protein
MLKSTIKNRFHRLAGAVAITVIVTAFAEPAAANYQNPNRDKSGTTGRNFAPMSLQRPENKPFASPGSLKAERGGFEPPVPVKGHSISNAAQSATLPPLLALTGAVGIIPFSPRNARLRPL